MNAPEPAFQGQPINSWRDVQIELRRRISTRIWKPGDLIPTEAELATEFGCARTTVNRAMREMASTGLLDRRRKAGTRVVENPVRKATLDIPVIRLEVEQRGAVWSHAVLQRRVMKPGAVMASRLRLTRQARTLHLRSLHMADSQPFVYEDRWINLSVVPAIEKADLDSVSANEWLVGHAPFTHGDFAFSAAHASAVEAQALNTTPGAALFVIDRTTFVDDRGITAVRLCYAPGYRMHLNA